MTTEIAYVQFYFSFFNSWFVLIHENRLESYMTIATIEGDLDEWSEEEAIDLESFLWNSIGQHLEALQ